MPPLLRLLLLFLSPAAALEASLLPPEGDPTEQGAVLFADKYNSTAEIVLFKSVNASWNYNTNLTDFNSNLQVGPLLAVGLGLGRGGCRLGAGRVANQHLAWHLGGGCC